MLASTTHKYDMFLWGLTPFMLFYRMTLYRIIRFVMDSKEKVQNSIPNLKAEPDPLRMPSP